MTSLLSLDEGSPFADPLRQGQCHPNRRYSPIGARRCRDLPRSKVQDPWQIATALLFFPLGSSVVSQGMSRAGRTGRMYFLRDVRDHGSQMLRSIVSWPLIR